MAAWRTLASRQRIMLAVLFLAVLLAFVDQPYPETAVLHHVPTLLMLGLAPWLLQRWPLSGRATGWLLLFWLLHTLGGRYTYSNVPYDIWWATLSGDAVGFTRNHYDRLVHFVFGLSFTLALREVLWRHVGATTRLASYGAVAGVLAAGSVYEIFEWLLTMVVAGTMADDYNGQQGDLWDPQKDMALALVGSVIASLTSFKQEREL